MDLQQMMEHFKKEIRPIFPPDSKLQSHDKNGGKASIEVLMGKKSFRIQFEEKALDNYKNSGPDAQKAADRTLKKRVQSGYRDGVTEVKIDAF